jgi:hypothetical protein
MNFMQFLKSLDDLLYEIMTWAVFYPVTMWRTLRHPWTMMEYADSELEDSAEQQFTDTLSPPLFLLLSLLLSHTIELTVLGQSPLVASRDGLASLVTDNTSLLFMRLVVFSSFPLIMGARMVRKQKMALTRDTLKQPFYSQCYLAAPFALLIGLGAIGIQLPWTGMRLAGLALMVVALLWYGGLQSRWFARKLDVSPLRAFGIASVGMVECVVAIALLAPLIA